MPRRVDVPPPHHHHPSPVDSLVSFLAVFVGTLLGALCIRWTASFVEHNIESTYMRSWAFTCFAGVWIGIINIVDILRRSR
jgi:hypothetical protein